MRKIDFPQDQHFFNAEHKAPAGYKEDLLDLYRFNLLLKLYRTIDKDNRLFADRKVLDAAGGYGREAYLVLAQKPKFLLLCDYSLKQINQAGEYLAKFNDKFLLCADAENLPFKDKSFDTCYITEALHHFIHPTKGIEEFIRITRGAIIIDEPAGGWVRKILNRIFILLRVKEEYERGYLEAFRVNKRLLKELCRTYKLNMLYFAYFIYYFGWYKNGKNKFIKVAYKTFLSILNIFFHFFGNRAMVIMTFEK